MPRPSVVLATVFGLGYLRPAAGTWGSLPPVLLALAMIWLGSNADLALGSLVIVSSAICLLGGKASESHFGRKDPAAVVIDEVAGQSLALLFLPWRALNLPNAWVWNLAIAAAAFVAFRILDITKPLPARQLQRLAGGVGILVDDLIAGFYALIIAQLAARYAIPLWIS